MWVVLYLQHLSHVVQSKSAVEEAVNALAWVHQASGLPPVSSLPLVQAALAGFIGSAKYAEGVFGPVKRISIERVPH